MRESVLIVDADTADYCFKFGGIQRICAKQRRTRKPASERNYPRSRICTKHFAKLWKTSVASDVRLEIPGIERRKYNVHIAPIELDETSGAIGFFYDITKIEHLENVRQEFLSNISHELRTPLTSIIAFVETLEDGAIEDRRKQHAFSRRDSQKCRTDAPFD